MNHLILYSSRGEQGPANNTKHTLPHGVTFCEEHNVHQINPSLQSVLQFLPHLSKCTGYSTVGTARSALSSFIVIDGIKLGSHPIVSRFMAGLFNIKPALPRYETTWDPQQVLAYLKDFPDVHDITLKLLTQKLVIIMALVSAQRTQTLQLLSLDSMNVQPEHISFTITSCLKQTRSSGGRTDLCLPLYSKVTLWMKNSTCLLC